MRDLRGLQEEVGTQSEDSRPRTRPRAQVVYFGRKDSAEIDPEETPEEIEARHSHQWMLIQETLYTEKSYVKSLKQLVCGEVSFFFCVSHVGLLNFFGTVSNDHKDSYEKMLRKHAIENNLDQLLLDTIFGSLFPIFQLQEKFLERLEVIVSAWKTDKQFGALFSEFVCS